MSVHAPNTILLVDDDDRFTQRLARALSERGLVVQVANDRKSALAVLAKNTIDLCTLDLRMPNVNSLDLLSEISRLSPDTRIIVVTGFGSIATAVEATRRGAFHYVQKPVDADELLLCFAKGSWPDAVASDSPVNVPSLARVEWEHIQRVLAECDGNISKAARALRIERRSLQRKLAKFPAPT